MIAALDMRTVAGGYLPCLLHWVAAEPSIPELAAVRSAVRRSGGGRLIRLDSSRLLVLVPGEPVRVRERLAAVVEAARPGAEIQAVIGTRTRPGERLAALASRLARVEQQATARGCEPVAWARHDSLSRLIERLVAREAGEFVEEQLAVLAAYDREHGTDLLRVLELALDHRDRNAAASAAFMHRNTFRRQLRRALELICADLDCPEERLALHLALKLRAWTREQELSRAS